MGVLPVMHFSHVLLLHYRQFCPLWAVGGCPTREAAMPRAVLLVSCPPRESATPPAGLVVSCPPREAAMPPAGLVVSCPPREAAPCGPLR